MGFSLASTCIFFSTSRPCWLGSEPSRVQHHNVERQYILRHSPSWTQFTAGLGQGWNGSFDELTGLAYRAWGPAIWLGQSDDVVSVERQVRTFINANPDLFQTKSSSFTDIEMAYQPELDSWLVEAQQSIPLSSPVVNDLDGSMVRLLPYGEEGKVQDSVRMVELVWCSAHT